MAEKIWIDGTYYDRDDAKISVFDHGLLYGDGVFEGIRAYNGKIFRHAAHIDRLYNSAKAIWLDLESVMSRDAMMKQIEECVKTNGLTDAYIRVLVTRGKGDLGLDPRKCPTPSVVIIAASIQLYPEEMYENGLKVISSSLRRVPFQCLPPAVKSLNYLNNILAKIEGIQAGVVEVLLLNMEGYVAECSGDNVFVVNGNAIATPPLSDGALGGITRRAIMELARDAGYDVIEKRLTQYDLYIADEVFLTGTAAEVIAVVELDGRKIGNGKPGATARKLRDLFMKEARGE